MDISQKQAALNKERADLVKRIEKLRDDLAFSEESVSARAFTLENDTLLGKDITKQIESVSHEKMRLEAMKGAITQGQNRITQIDFELAENRKLAAVSSINEGAIEARSRLVKCIAQLYDVQAEMDAIEEKINSLNQNPEGITMDNASDETQLTVRLLKYFGRTDGESIKQKLLTIERSYPAIAAQVGAIKSH